MLKKILVYGSREFGQIVKRIVEDCGHEFSGFIDDYYSGECVVGTYELIKSKYSPSMYHIVIAIGYRNLKARWNVYKMVTGDGYSVPSLVHPLALVSEDSKLGDGSIIMKGAIIDYNCILDELVIVWPGVVINHDCIIGRNNYISPNSTICGFVQSHQNCFIGAGSVVVDHNTIPEETFLKAGQVYKGSQKGGLDYE